MLKDILLEPHQLRELSRSAKITLASPQSLASVTEENIPPYLAAVISPESQVQIGKLELPDANSEYFAVIASPLTRPGIHALLNGKFDSSPVISPYEILYKWQQLDRLPKRLRRAHSEYDRFSSQAGKFRETFSHNVDLLVSHARSKLIPFEQACIEAARYPYKALYHDTIYGRFVSPGYVDSVLKYQFTAYLRNVQPDLARERASPYKRKRGIMFRQLTTDQTRKKFKRLPQNEQEKLWSDFLKEMGPERARALAEDFVEQKYRKRGSIKRENGEVIIDHNRHDKSWIFRAAGDLDTITACHESDLQVDVEFPRDPETGTLLKKTAQIRNSKLLIPVIRWEAVSGGISVSTERLPGIIRAQVIPAVRHLVPDGMSYDSRLLDSYTGYFLATHLSAEEMVPEEDVLIPWNRGRDLRRVGAAEYPVYIMKTEVMQKIAAAGLMVNLHRLASHI